MSVPPIHLYLPPQVYGMKGFVSINIWGGGVLVPSRTDEQHGPVYVSLLARNIQAVPSPSIHPFRRHKTQAGGLIQLHMVATPPEIVKSKGSTLCNVPYL